MKKMCVIIEEVGKDNNFSERFITLVVNALLRNGIETTNDILKLDKKSVKDLRGINAQGKSWELIEKVQEVLREKQHCLRIFLSHKMNGLTDDEVFRIRRRAEKYLRSRYGNVTIIDNFHHDNAPTDAGRLWHLGESIKMMEEADGVYFCPGWMDAKGCQIEYEICKTYGLRILN